MGEGATEKEARDAFKATHSTRRIPDAQVWAVTPDTHITDMGSFAMPRVSYCAPERVK